MSDFTKEERDRPVTAAELIAALQNIPPDTKIVVSGYEGGVSDVTLPSLDRLFAVRRNVHTEWYYGAHEKVSAWEADYITAPKDSVLL